MSVWSAVILGVAIASLLLAIAIGDLVVTQVEQWVKRLALECSGCGRPWEPSSQKIVRFFLVPPMGFLGLFVCGLAKLRGIPIQRAAKLFALVAFASFVERRVARGEIAAQVGERVLTQLSKELEVEQPARESDR